MIARTCMSPISGNTIGRRQPRKPIIGLNSCSSSTRSRPSAGRDADLLGDFFLALHVVVLRQELVQRRIEQADGDRVAVHRFEDADEVLLLERLDLGERLLATFDVRRPRIISRTAVMRSSPKNMCSVRQRPMPSAPNSRAFSGVGRAVGVRANLELAGLVGPLHQRREVAGHGRGDRVDLADHHVAGRAVDGDEVAGLEAFGPRW